MVKKYRVLFHNPITEAGDFKTGMARIGVPAATVDHMIAGAPVVLKGGMSLPEARQYADAVQEAGGRATIEADGFMEDPAHPDHSSEMASIATYQDFTMCPMCGFKQQRGPRCIKCGLAFT
ncbi:MAG: hypothetical protein JRK53_08725 [Deltaproteobacteria bacterium]|nr:hypothetical protein [Deltaproteobacteria bacterium]